MTAPDLIPAVSGTGFEQPHPVLKQRSDSLGDHLIVQGLATQILEVIPDRLDSASGPMEKTLLRPERLRQRAGHLKSLEPVFG